ncbi:MAG: hypothetical protein JSV27_10765 [Candidatus Bathyarchaeota archaeon]|nr:MAG: hypothetical protein JSV27_10765 [Candidatus Bathyarchaeota archaeon]
MKASSKKGKIVKKSIPWELHMAIVRLQGAEELEYEEACVRAAVLIEEGDEKYRENVRAEANRMYKSRFMAEQNRAKNTWHKKGYDEGFTDGEAKGFDAAKNAYQITYPCSNCGDDIILIRNGEDTMSALEYLKSQGWRHGQCG